MSMLTDERRPPVAASLADRLPPQNLEAERGVIGASLLDNQALDEALAILRPERMYRDSHQVIWRAMADLRDGGRPVDLILLEEELTRRGELARVGGLEALIEIMDSVPHSANAAYYARIVLECDIARGLIQASLQTLHECYGRAFDADSLMGRAEARVLAVSEGDTRERIVRMRDGVPETVDRIRRRKAGEVDGLATGLDDLDALIGGLVGGRLVILAARPAMGKTALALNLAHHLANLGLGVLFVSQEMGSGELIERLISGRSGVDGTRIRDGHVLSAEDLRRIERAGVDLARLALPIDETTGRTAGQIATVARRLRSRERVDLVVVDYIQLLEPDPSLARSSRQEQVAAIGRRLKGLARELSVPVLALSQLNRGVEIREDKRPRMADLRESGSLEQDADQVLLLHRPEYYDPNDQPGVAELIVAKNRHGATGLVMLHFDKPTSTFRLLADRDQALSFEDAY